MQPDIGQTLLIVFSGSVLIFISGINIFILFGLSIFAFISLAYLIMYVPKFDYIQSRIFSFFNRDTGTHNFQSDKAIESITSGGYFGKGIGEGTLKNRVPEAHTDYIISVISEEFGVVAIMLILLLFLIFINFVPIILIAITSLLTGSKIKTMWLTPFYLYFGLFFVYIFQKNINLKKLKTFLISFSFFFFIISSYLLNSFHFKNR